MTMNVGGSIFTHAQDVVEKEKLVVTVVKRPARSNVMSAGEAHG